MARGNRTLNKTGFDFALTTRQRSAPGWAALYDRSWRRQLLLGTVFSTGLLTALAMTPEQALAACTNTGAFPNITAFDCTAADTNGHTIGTFVLGVPISGNTSNITGTIQPAASISNAAGSAALSIVLNSGADLSITGTDPFNSISSVNANAFQFGTMAAGSIVTLNYAGQISATNGNAVNGLALNGNTVNLTFGSTALVTATGAGDLLGVPTSGGGVILTNASGAVDWTVTNQGQFRTQNDSIAMINLLGTGTHTINNSGTLGTQAQPSGGAGAFIFAPNANSTGLINNNGGAVYATGNGYLGDFGGLAVVTGGNAEIRNNAVGGVGGYVNTVNDPGILAVSVLGGNATVDGATGTVISTNGPGIAALALGNGNATVTAGNTSAGANSLTLAGFALPAINVPGVGPLSLSGGVMAVAAGTGNADATVTSGSLVAVNGGTFGVTAISFGGTATATLNGVTIDPPVIGGSAIVLGGAGNATVNANDADIDATGFGLLAVNLGSGQSNINMENTIIGAGTAPTSAGVLGVTLGGGNVDIEGAGSTVTAGNAGVFGLALGGGNVWIDTGAVTTTVNGGLLSGGVLGLTTNGTVDIDVGGNVTSAGGFGVVGITLNGNTGIDVENRVISAVNGLGVIGIANNGNVDIEARGSDITSAGIGIGAFANNGNVWIDAGAVTTTGAGFLSSAVGGVAIGGNVDIDLHGNIITNGGTFGVLGVSVGGNATVTSDAGILIDPPIGMAAVTIGSGLATVANNAVVQSTVIGLLGVNIGDGAVLITNSDTATVNATTGGGVVAFKLGDGNLANSVDGIHSVVVTNNNAGGLGGLINAPNGPGIAVIAFDPTFTTGNNVLITNTEGATVIGEGGLLSPVVGVLADGNVTIRNDQGSSLTSATGQTGLAIGVLSVGGLGTTVVSSADVTNDRGSSILGNITMFATNNATVTNDRGSDWTFSGISAITALNDATLNNDRGAQITANGGLLAIAGNNATINNDRGADINFNGVNANVMLAVTDASITNDRGATFNMTGLNANVMIAGNNATILNDRGAEFNITGVGGNFMLALTGDAIITNDRGAEFNFTGINGNFMAAGNNASILNDRGGAMTFAGSNGNFMAALNDASITNDRGGEMSFIGLTGNFMAAGNNASILNDRGGEMSFTGFTGNFMAAGVDANITNDRGGEMTFAGFSGDFMLAGNNASIVNDRGGELNLFGISGNFLTALNGNATVSNTRGAEINMVGINAIQLNAPNGVASLTNAQGAEINMVGLNGMFFSGGLLAEVNNSANDGNNNQACLGRAGICVNGVGAFIGNGPATLNFNNAGGVVSMINGSSTVVTDAAAFFGLTGLAYPNYNTGVGDITVIGGNFNGTGGSQLGVDTFVAGNNNSSSDLMIVTGATSGQTRIVVNDLNGGPGTYNTSGIPIVAVTSGNTNGSHFRLDPSSTNFDSKFGGVLDKGLFFYYLTQKNDPVFPGGIDHVLVSAPDSELFELSKATAGAQNIWYETTGTWLERTADLRNFLMARGGIAAGAGADMPVKARPMAPPPSRSITPGVWMKALGSWTDRDSNDTFAGAGRTFGFDTSYKQKTFGLIGGIDGGWDYKDSVFMVGLLGGYLDSNLKFNASQNSFDYKGGTVGAYATYLNRGFFFDTVFKADMLKMTWNANTLAGFGLSSPETDANSYGVMIDTGYRMFDNGAFFFEPLGSFAWVRTSIDSINVLGTQLNLGDSDSMRGSLGGRLGFASMWGATKVEASITGRVWHEFEDPNALQVVTSGPLLQIQDQFDGTYGDVNGTVNFIGLTSGWSSFMNGGVKFNSDFTTVSAKGGVRYNW